MAPALQCPGCSSSSGRLGWGQDSAVSMKSPVHPAWEADASLAVQLSLSPSTMLIMPGWVVCLSLAEAMHFRVGLDDPCGPFRLSL